MILAYALSVVAAFGLILGGAIADVIPRPTIIALAAIPLALPVYRGMQAFYESPYELMPRLGKGVQLHMAAGLLLVLGYVIAIVASHNITSPPFFLR